MARYPSEDVIATHYTLYTTGKLVKAVSTAPTEIDLVSTKIGQELPKFIPGRFLVKPYSVSSRRVDPIEILLKSGTFVRSDGVKFYATFSGPVNGRKLSLDALDWNVASQEQLRAYCVHKALSKVNEAVWDSMIDLAEIASTYRLLRSGSDKLADALGSSLVKAAKKAKKDLPQLGGVISSMLDGTFSGTRLAKHLGSKKRTWGNADGRRPRDGFTNRDIKAYNDVVDYFNQKLLEYRYGWFPLYLSLCDAFEALHASLLAATKQIKTARSRQEKTESTSKSGTPSNNWTEVRVQKTYRVEGIAYYRRTLDQRMIDMLGLKPENIPSVVWELTKLSFVWDWLLAVGTWLEAMKPQYGIEILGTTDSQKTEITNKWFCVWKMGQAPPVTTEPEEAKFTAFDRKVGNVQTLPAFTGLDRMNPQRWADAAALSFKPLRRLAALLSKR